MAVLNTSDGLQRIDHHVGVLEIPPLPISTMGVLMESPEQILGLDDRCFSTTMQRTASNLGWIRGPWPRYPPQVQGSLRVVDHHVAALERRTGHGNERDSAHALLRDGCLALDDGDLARAEGQLRRALELAEQLSDRPAVADCLDALGRLAIAPG